VSTTPDQPTDQPNHDAPAPSVHELEQQRRTKRDQIAAMGINPYGERTDGLRDLDDVKRDFESREGPRQEGTSPPKIMQRDATPYRIAGRIMLMRDGGKLVWLNLRDATGDLQVAVSQKDVDAASFALVKLADLADLVIAEGAVTRTRTGEVTLWASRLSIGSKALVPPPEKWAGLQDTELRYRQRYVDLWSNPETMRVAMLRTQIVSRIRAFLTQRGYAEVETPMLQTLAGGAAARPFITRMNALGIDLFMRIAPELYLKRLLVGGMPRVFEVNRNFRNEGLDKQHNPEFTMIELYHAFGDMETVMEVTESLIRDAASHVAPSTGAQSLALPFGELTIDYAPAFDRVRYADLFERYFGFAMADPARVRAEAQRRGVRTKNEQGVELDHWLVVNQLFEAFAEPTLDPARPTFITHYPAALSPLTRPNRDDPTLADRADLFIGGMELAPHYTELNDPDVQEARFREQLSGLDDEESTFRTFDEDFVRALKVGMPPAGGMGLGIDRLTMLLTNQRTIRDVVLFPLMRPLDS
jgi:lysyl-tRNA synthetase class 2